MIFHQRLHRHLLRAHRWGCNSLGMAGDSFPGPLAASRTTDSIPRLRFPQNDAIDLAEILGDKESCRFEPHVHVNKPSYKVLEDLYGISCPSSTKGR
jgi:hypothetical protein